MLTNETSLDNIVLTKDTRVKTMQLYEVSLVTINLQISYDSGIIRHDYGITEVCQWIIRGLPTDGDQWKAEKQEVVELISPTKVTN